MSSGRSDAATAVPATHPKPAAHLRPARCGDSEPPPPPPPPPSVAAGDIDRTGAESGGCRRSVYAQHDKPIGGGAVHGTEHGGSTHSGAVREPGCLTEGLQPSGDVAQGRVDTRCPTAAHIGDCGMTYTARQYRGGCVECVGSPPGRDTDDRVQTAPGLHADLQPSVFQLHISKPPPPLAGQWHLDNKGFPRTLPSRQTSEASEESQHPADGTVDTWPCDREASCTPVPKEELSLEEMLSDGLDSSVLVADNDDDDDDDEDPVPTSAERASEMRLMLNSSCPRAGGVEAGVLSRISLSSGGDDPVTSRSLPSSGREVPRLSGTSPSRIPRRRQAPRSSATESI